MTDKDRLEQLAKRLRKRRERYGLRQIDMAKLAKIPVDTYGVYERGKLKHWTKTADEILDSNIFKDHKINRVKAGSTARFKRKREDLEFPEAISIERRRIPNIPNFYERLSSICDKSGKIIVDDNHPTLRELRVAVGGKKYMMNVDEFRTKLIEKRKEKGLTQEEAAKLAGVKPYALRSYEYRGVKSKTEVYHKIVNSPLFD